MRKILSILLLLFLLNCTVLAAGGNPKIVDQAGLLDDATSEIVFTEQAEKIAETYGVDVVIVTVNSLNGKTSQRFADDYYDDHGYGIGSDYSGILLLVSMEHRDWAISTCGRCTKLFTDRDLDNLFDSMSYQLSSGNYAKAFGNYLYALEEHLAGQSSDGSSTPNLLFRLVIALAIGAAAGGITLAVMRSKMNTAKRQSGAGDYVVNGSFHLYRQQDIYLYSRTSRTRRQQSSTHNSSSGRSHGGRSGKF